MPRRIHHISVSNWKAARNVAFAPAIGVTQIVGPNESGKSSTLDAVIGTLAGARKRKATSDRVAMDERPLRIGELRGGCKLDLGDIEVERVLTEANAERGGSLKVTTKSGAKMGQRDLDTLFGDYSFDPLAIARMKADELVKVLQQLSGPEWVEEMARIESELATAEVERTAAGRRFRALGTQPDPGPEPEEVKVDDAIAELARAGKHNDEQQMRARALERAGDEVRRAEGAHAFSERRVAELEAELAGAKMAAAENGLTLERARYALENLPQPEPFIDATPLQKRIADAGALTRQREGWQAARRRYDEWRAASREQAGLETRISELRDQREKHARTAQLPVPGLTWQGGVVLVDGKPWSQESTSKLLRICTKLAMALHPDLRVILIHQGEGLDQQSFTEICELAHAQGVDVLMEVVGEPHEGGDAVIEIREGVGGDDKRDW